MVVMGEETSSRLDPSLFIWVDLSAIWLQPQHRCPALRPKRVPRVMYYVRSSRSYNILACFTLHPKLPLSREHPAMLKFCSCHLTFQLRLWESKENALGHAGSGLGPSGLLK
jgi:hypothetical protein